MVGATSFASAQKTTTEVTMTEARMTDAVAAVHAMPLVCDVKLKTYYVVDEKTGKIKVPNVKSNDLSWCIENDFHKIDKETSRLTDYWFLTKEDMEAFKDAKGYFIDNDLKNYAMFRSQQYHKCDVILAPVFSYRTATKDEQSSAGNSVALTLTVMGYAGEFVDFRPATKADYSLLIDNHNLKVSGTGDKIYQDTKDSN